MNISISLWEPIPPLANIIRHCDVVVGAMPLLDATTARTVAREIAYAATGGQTSIAAMCASRCCRPTMHALPSGRDAYADQEDNLTGNRERTTVSLETSPGYGVQRREGGRETPPQMEEA